MHNSVCSSLMVGTSLGYLILVVMMCDHAFVDCSHLLNDSIGAGRGHFFKLDFAIPVVNSVMDKLNVVVCLSLTVYFIIQLRLGENASLQLGFVILVVYMLTVCFVNCSCLAVYLMVFE